MWRYYILACGLVVLVACESPLVSPISGSASTQTTEITPRPKGGTLEITPRPKGSTILRGIVQPPPGFRIVEETTGPFRILLQTETAQASAMTDNTGAFEIKGVPLGVRLNLEAQASKEGSKLVLKALLDMPDTAETAVESLISVRTTAIHALVKHTEKMESTAQFIPLSQFEAMPELMAVVKAVEDEMVPLMQEGKKGDMAEMPAVKEELEKARKQMEALQSENAELMDG